jgi:hypothetical protein
MMTRTNPAAVLACVAALLLSACAALAPAETLDQRLAYAYGAHTAVLNAAATSVELGDISADQGQAVLELADRARLVLDSARAVLAAGDPRAAEDQLALALAVLTELQAYLRRSGR